MLVEGGGTCDPGPNNYWYYLTSRPGRGTLKVLSPPNNPEKSILYLLTMELEHTTTSKVVWEIDYSGDDPPRRLWRLIAPPPRVDPQPYISLGPTYPYLFPLQRIKRLLANQTADNNKFYVPDAITFDGRIEEFNLVYTSDKNYKQQINDWIAAGQIRDNVEKQVSWLEMGLGKNGFGYQSDNEGDGLPKLSQKYFIYFIDILPSDVDCPPTESYWKLQPDTFGMLSVGGGLHPPLEGYISLATYRTLVPNSIPGQAGHWGWTSKYRLPIRNEDGHVKWMKCSPSEDRQNADTWRGYFDLSTLACETQNEKTRRTNPIMELTIHRTGFGKLDIDELQTIFASAATRCSQTFRIVLEAPIEGYQYVNLSLPSASSN